MIDYIENMVKYFRNIKSTNKVAVSPSSEQLLEVVDDAKPLSETEAKAFCYFTSRGLYL